MTGCPFNKSDTWIHNVVKEAVTESVGHDIVRELVDAFGYGKSESKHVDEFWNKEI